MLLALFVRVQTLVTRRVEGEGGQTTAEYALVILAAAAVAVIIDQVAGSAR